MATIKAIENRSIHQIQSGQVIVDLTSVVKELVENSLDAGASKIDIRFKNYGLDSIEVQDDGNGIAPEDFANVALKHHTSKLSKFEDLDNLETFGFRGEAISSLCALAKVYIITARAQDGPLGKRLEFAVSGKLTSTSDIAAQKGTTIGVENIFHALPVRRKELEKHIKREWLKVLHTMYSYACIGIGIRFTLSNQPAKGKKSTAISTRGNPTLKENIANVFNAAALAGLVNLDLELELQRSTVLNAAPDQSRKIHVIGHVSKPGYGQGRQTPDRQMYFVNSRPCLLPQVSKVFNEVYKSFNHHQAPFVLANLMMDTTAYDVNVSPDKKTIMLHNQTVLLENLKTSLTELFQNTDHTMPQSQLPAARLPKYKSLTVQRPVDNNTSDDSDEEIASVADRMRAASNVASNLIESWAGRDSTMRKEGEQAGLKTAPVQKKILDGPQFMDIVDDGPDDDELLLEQDDELAQSGTVPSTMQNPRATNMTTVLQDPHRASYDAIFTQPGPKSTPRPLAQTSQSRNFGTQRSQHVAQAGHAEEPIPSVFNSMPKVSSGPINDAFARMRPRRGSPETAEITIGDQTVRTAISGGGYKKRRIHISGAPHDQPASSTINRGILDYAMPGSQLAATLRSTHPNNYSEHSDSDAELTDIDGTPVLSNSTGIASSHDRAAFDLGLSRPMTKGQTSTPGNRASIVDIEVSGETEEERREREDGIVAQLIHDAETKSTSLTTTQRGLMTTQSSTRRKGLVYNLNTTVRTSIERIRADISRVAQAPHRPQSGETDGDVDAETKLSLTVSKTDFARMTVVGQFNDGFILAVRPRAGEDTQDELFIVDQHAADEKANYERLQKTEVLQRQPLVHPKQLELTAIEQEVVSTHSEALRANGFEIETLEEEDSNRSYRLLTLPTMRNTTFKVSDLEELLHLLSELSIDSNEIPRPRKVQKHLAMKACRSSIMIGTTLRKEQMVKVVRHMGGMEKPWNCPHGRPTMRHLTSLGSWEGWQEGQSVEDGIAANVDLKAWLRSGDETSN